MEGKNVFIRIKNQKDLGLRRLRRQIRARSGIRNIFVYYDEDFFPFDIA